MKKSKILRVFAALLAFLIIGFVLWFANGFIGNPVSKFLAQSTARKYIAANYADMDIQLEKAFYSFKSGDYHVFAKSRVSRDTSFTISVSPTGKLLGDTYDSDVTQRYNTYRRIDEAYRSMVNSIFDAADFPYKSDISYGIIEIKDRDVEIGAMDPKYGIEMHELILDKEYNIHELAKISGHVVLYTQDDQVTAKRASEMLLELKEIFDKAKVPFYAIDFVLEKSRSEDSKPNPDGIRINVNNFLYSDIYKDGLESRVQEAHDELTNYYKTEDAKKIIDMDSFNK